MVARLKPIVDRMALGLRTDETMRAELRSAGYEALSLAVLRYREEAGEFEPFARLAIRGALLRTMGREYRAQRSLVRFSERQVSQLPSPREASLEEALSAQVGDERADIVAALERVACGFLCEAAVRAAFGEETILAREAEREIVHALEGVEPADRTVFFAHVINGKTHREIIADTGVNQRTLQRMIERAGDVVRNRLRAKDLGPQLADKA